MSEPDLRDLTLAEYATYMLASAAWHIPDPQKGGPRGQMILWIDTWYPQTQSLVQKLRESGDRGVLLFDRECKEGLHY